MIIDNIIQLLLLCINFNYFVMYVLLYNNYKFMKYNNYFIENNDQVNKIIGSFYYSIEYLFILFMCCLFKVGVIKEFYLEMNKLYIVYDTFLYKTLINTCKSLMNYVIKYLLNNYNLFKIMDLFYSGYNSGFNYQFNNQSNNKFNNILNNIKTNMNISDNSSSDSSDDEYSDNMKKVK